MTPEAIDLCQNYHQIVQGYASPEATKSSDIRNYYMSDSLLEMPLSGDNHYYQVLQKAVFTEAQSTPAQLASMTKAYLKDGNVDHALSYFEQGIQERRKQAEGQEEMLVKMYDEVFAHDGVTLDVFKEKYYSLIVAREKMKKEIKAAQMLEDILERCDPEEIDNIFLLQAVMKEEKSLLS